MITLNDGRDMPALGMGTYQIADAQAAMIVREGIDLGFKLVDTAAIYRNELGVGEGVRETGVWLTTKLWNDRHRDPAAALDESLALLGADSVDLYLIHWPCPDAGDHVDAWRALVALRDAGKARSIGVSNFLPGHLDAIVAATGVTPAVNQIELHPRFQQRELVAYHQAHGIVTQSWSPLGQGGDILRDPAITRIAEAHGRSAAQVILAWHLAKGFSVIPKASDRGHLSDNFASMDVALSAGDIAAIDALDSPNGRIGPDPATFG
jgi:2,5-diketo-D-gluconate reductase A